MEATIDFSDTSAAAAKALDLSNIRFQLMYGPRELFKTVANHETAV
jgi:hypothetical protein